MTTFASGSRSLTSASTASSRSRGAPLFATITGSTTRGKPKSLTAFATAPMIPALLSIPVLPASIPMSSATTRTCS